MYKGQLENKFTVHIFWVVIRTVVLVSHCFSM